MPGCAVLLVLLPRLPLILEMHRPMPNRAATSQLSTLLNRCPAAHTGCATLKTLEQWAQVSQACQLDELHAICVCRLAAKLAVEGNSTKKGVGMPVKAALQAAQQLRHCDQDVLLQVIAVLATNARSVDLQARGQPDLLRAAAAELHRAPVSGRAGPSLTRHMCCAWMVLMC